MSLRINHNIDAMVGQANLAANSANLSASLKRLSSGLRINSAADNPSGLVISEQMRAQITGLNQAVSNTQNAVSMVQTTEGALDEVNALLNKARQLTLDAANTGVNDTNQLNADQSELDNVISSITRISTVTQFGTKNLLDGSLDGASLLSSGISHVRVGNLANNSAISVGMVNLSITAGVRQGQVLQNSNAAHDSYIFSGAVTGVKMGTKHVVSGVTVTLTIGTGAVAYTTTGSLSAAGLAAKLNALTSSIGFGVTSDASGSMVVKRTYVGKSSFASTISFSRAASSGLAGTKGSMTATLKTIGPSVGSGASNQIFGVAHLSGVTTSSVVNCGTIFSYTLRATGLNVNMTGTKAAGMLISGATKTLSQVLSGIQTDIRTRAGFANAIVSLLTGVTSGLRVKVSRGDDTIATAFNFALTVDFKNNAVAKSTVSVLKISGNGVACYTSGNGAGNATFISGAALTSVSGNKITGATRLNSGSALELTICGQTVKVSGNRRSMIALAAALNTAVGNLGLTTIHVGFATGGKKISGLATALGLTYASSGAPGISNTGSAGFVLWSSDGKAFNASLRVDQKQGLNVNIANTAEKAGQMAGATLDLTTVSQVSGVHVSTIAAQSGRTVKSTAAATTTITGTNAKATMTMANAVVLNLDTSFTGGTGVVQLTLTTGSQAAGYQDFSVEITKTLAVNGGAANFTLANGALFQIGANGGQQVGLTIDAASAADLGRNTATSLSSLADLRSTNKGALTNGLTSDALKVIDAAINQITNLRGTLGAFQANTLQAGLNSLQVSNQNLTAAESTIRDVDFAAESANFTKSQILVQASTSMLAQANQLPQSVLKLLG